MAATETKKPVTEEQQQELDAALQRAGKALAVIETYDQARVDRLCQAVAWAVANKRTFSCLVEMGIAESGLGDAESRMGKRMKIRGVLRDALRQKSVGIIEEVPEKGIVKYGKPAGIVACIVPTTNPAGSSPASFQPRTPTSLPRATPSMRSRRAMSSFSRRTRARRKLRSRPCA